MEEMKFFLLPFPLKTKTKKKTTCAWSWICTFSGLPDCCKFQINSGIIVLQLSSEFGLYYFLLFIFLFFWIVLILNASFCYVWCLELFFVISLTFWSLFIEFFLQRTTCLCLLYCLFLFRKIYLFKGIKLCHLGPPFVLIFCTKVSYSSVFKINEKNNRKRLWSHRKTSANFHKLTKPSQILK